MKRIEIILLIITLLCTFNCQKKTDNNGPKIIMSYGIKHVYNSSYPRDGTATLELQKILDIDSQDIESENPVFFHLVTHGPDNSIFLGDGKAVKIYKFASDGRLICCFAGKGNGPGEFPYLGRIQIADNKVWITNAQKMAGFETNGKFLFEKKFKKKYWPIEVIDKNRFLGNFAWNETGKKVPNKMVALLDSNESILNPILKSDITGMIRIEKNGFQLAFSNNVVTPRIITLYNRLNGLAYLAVTNEYKIILKDIKGNTRQLIFKDHKNRKLSPEDKNSIANMFHYLSTRERKILKENLPGTFCAIKNIQLLRWGYMAVYRIIGVNSMEIDIFDSNGEFVYIVKLPAGIPDSFMFYNGRIAGIEQKDNGSIYMEYQITNINKIFGK